MAREILLSLSVILLCGTSAVEVNETTTVSFLETTDPVTESTNDDLGVADAPLESSNHDQLGVESKEDLSAVEKPVAIAFPPNHRNFTASQFLGEVIQYPQYPYYDRLNKYQQQYKAYLEQKQLFSRKPVKFEDNSIKNFYVPQTSNVMDLGKDGYGFLAQEEKKQEVQKKPFPYAFEQEKVQDWYKNPGLGVVHEEHRNELASHGHQEVPQFYFSQGHSHEQKLYKTEPVTYIHQTVKKSKGSPWKKVFHLLTALVPLGLILASLTPNVISVNSTAVTKNSKQRSEDSLPVKFKEEDVVEIMNKLGVESLSEAQCEDRVICELARRGDAAAAGSIEKGFWFLANETPWDAAERAGMNDLFKAIKTGTCESYKCYSKAKSTHKNGLGKKLIRKRKIPEK